jgi:hypothetical protein
MAAEQSPIRIQPESDLDLVVRDAIAGKPVLVELESEIYEVAVRPVSEDNDVDGEQRDSLFNIVGMSRGGPPTDVARHKDEYLTGSHPRDPR